METVTVTATKRRVGALNRNENKGSIGFTVALRCARCAMTMVLHIMRSCYPGIWPGIGSGQTNTNEGLVYREMKLVDPLLFLPYSVCMCVYAISLDHIHGFLSGMARVSRQRANTRVRSRSFIVRVS